MVEVVILQKNKDEIHRDKNSAFIVFNCHFSFEKNMLKEKITMAEHGEY